MSLYSIIDNQLTTGSFNLKRDKWLVLYTFMAVFLPPMLPVPMVYLLGLFTVVWLYYKGRSRINLRILKYSHLRIMMKVFLCFFLYVIVIGLLDMMLIETANVTSTRMSSINQVSVLTLFEFCFIWAILIECHRRNYSLTDIFILIIFAGILQGVCAVMAFLLPPVRSVFMLFGDKALYSNVYFLELRGFGFSINLIDTFGYGLGLIASYMLIVKWTKSYLLLFCSIVLILFTILVNARTGIAVFGMGIIINFFLKRDLWRSLVRVIVLIVIFELSIPFANYMLDNLAKSRNNTVAWIATGSKQMLLLVGADDSGVEMGVEEVSFFDNFIDPPSDTFEFLFGTGHHVYDTYDSMGFRTDIGYLNMLWEFGIIGSAIVLLVIGWFIITPFFKTKNLIIRKIALLNLIAYGVVLMKAILIGCNPGVMVNYFAIFSLYYIINKKRIGVRKPRCVIEKRDSDVSAPVVDSNSGL